MVGRAPGGNGCPGLLEVTALRWLRGHSWLNSWFFRGGPPRSVGSAVTTPRQGPPSKVRPACLRHRVPPPRSPPRSIIADIPEAFFSIPLFLSFIPSALLAAITAARLRRMSYLSFSLSPLLTFYGIFLNNLLIPRR